MDALRRSSKISRKERIRNVTIWQQIGLQETTIKKLKRTNLHGTAMFKKKKKRLPKNNIEVDTETKERTRKTEVEIDGGYKKAMNERNLNKGRWEDRKNGV
jgi:hypothetical protein